MVKRIAAALFVAAALFFAPVAVEAEEKTDAQVQRIPQMLYPRVMFDPA